MDCNDNLSFEVVTVEVLKEIARPGTFVYTDQHGLPQTTVITPARMKHWHDAGNQMVKENLSIPIPLEHQRNIGVMTAAERAAANLKSNAGFIDKYKFGKVKEDDGSEVEALFGVMDIKDADIAKKIPEGSIRSVSPWLNSFTDGKGKRWDDVISHVALTLRPVIAKQSPFESIGAAMLSLADQKDVLTVPDGFGISRAAMLVKKDGKLKPRFPKKFSLLTGIRLSKEELDEEPEPEDEESKADDEDAKGKKDGEGDPMASAMKDGMDSGEKDEDGNDVSFEELIRHLLEMHDIHVPAGGRGKEFLQSLAQGLLASAKEKMAKDETEDETGGILDQNQPGQPKPAGPIKQEQPPMYMSLTAADVAKITDPEKKAMAEAFLSMRGQLEATSKNILADAAVQRQARIERISTKLPAAARDKILAKATSTMLSLSPDGVVIDPLADYLDIMESSIPDLPEMLQNGVKLSLRQHPADDGTLTDAQAKELADKQGRINPAA